MWRTQFLGKTHHASNIWEFRFAHPEGFDYLPGQYAAFAFPELVNDTRGQSRVMSLTSHPSDKHIAFVTRVSERPSPFKTRLFQLETGESVMLDTALGDLVLPRSSVTPLVFVAGGIGIASFISMLRDIELSGEQRDVHLLYALRGHEERLFSDVLTTFPFVRHEEFVAPKRLDAQTIIHTTNTPDETLYYLSGTERFVEGLRADLLALGLSDTQIVFDYFTGYSE